MISEQLPELPLDIITDILTRLPVKSLIRFKCVSKSVQALISSTQFINTHLNIFSTIPDSTRIIMKSIDRQNVFTSYSLNLILNSHTPDAQELDFPLKDTNAVVDIVGSYNGLVCITIQNDFFIWNPSTTVSKKLPSFEVAYLKLYGFGFDERSDDYKVVVFFDSKRAGVYSLRADSWKTIEDSPYLMIGEFLNGKFLDGKFLNGSLHWVGLKDVSKNIICLDLSDETYGEIEKPGYNSGYYFPLGVLQGCLCVLAVVDLDRYDLWIMKEYGVRDSWVKLCDIMYVDGPGYLLYSLPLTISSSGEILFIESIAVLYNPSDRTIKEPWVPKDYDRFFYMATYIESLVSPNLDGL